MKLALAFVAALAIVGAATPSSAQVISASQVLSDCPDVPRARACPALATSFLGSSAASTGKDRQIVDLVVAIAEAAQQNNVPRRSCLNAADGIRVLATGVSTAEQASQISDIADALCAGNRTASVGRPGAAGGNGGFSFSVPESLSEQSSGGGGGTLTVASAAPTGNDETGPTEEVTDPVTVTDDPGNSQCAGQSCQSSASETGLNPPGLENKEKKEKEKKDK